MFSFSEELGFQEPLLKEGNFFRIVRIIVVGDSGFIKFLGDDFVSVRKESY